MKFKNKIVLLIVSCILACSSVLYANDSNEVVNLKKAIIEGSAQINPAKALTVDIEKFLPSEGENLLVLQVFNNYYYHTIEQDKTIYVFSGTNGKPTKGSPKFKGINKFDPVFLIVGKEAFPGSLDAGALISTTSIPVRVDQ